MRAPISIADVIRAYAVLRPRSRIAKQRIATTLGFDVSAARARDPREEAPSAGAAAQLVSGGIAQRPEHVPLAAQPIFARDLGLRLTGPIAHEAPSFPIQGDAKLFERDVAARSAPFPSLFVPGWTRAILSTALVHRMAIGALDLDVTLERLSRAEPLTRLPRQRIPAMASHVLVLLDIGAGMLPFTEDQRALIEALRLVAGRSAVEALNYVGSPIRVGTGAPSRWRHFNPPPGCAVLVVGELGISGASRRAPAIEAWVEVVRAARQRGCQLVGFVPYPSARWPPRIARLLHLVHWDRSTHVSRVKSAGFWS